MDAVWIVMGTTGEYSDKSEWPVLAFTTEDAAKNRIIALEERMQKIPQEWRDACYASEELLYEHMKDLDPCFDMDYAGTSYFLLHVSVVE